MIKNMNKKTLTMMVVTLAVISGIGFAVWGLLNREIINPVQAGVLFDYSDSRNINCQSLDSLTSQIFALPNIKKSSTVYFYSTGDEQTADEPILLDTYRIPTFNKVVEGRDKYEKERITMVENIKQRCSQERVKKRSPILLAIKRVVENLRVKKCDGKTECSLFIQTDGQELSEPAFNHSLQQKNKRSKALAENQPKIDNNGISIKFCGFAEVLPSKNVQDKHLIQDANNLVALWESYFTNPEKITFEPHCQ